MKQRTARRSPARAKPAEGKRRPLARTARLTLAETTAKGWIDSSVPMAVLIQQYMTGEASDIGVAEAAARQLMLQVRAVQDGDLSGLEAKLVMQAFALDAMFFSLAGAAASTNQTMEHKDTLTRLALRSQSQSRHTIETLALIKNPGAIAFVKQANIGQAVQVNNGVPLGSRAGEIGNRPVELLEDKRGQVDSSTTAQAGKVDPPVEAMALVDRAENPAREGRRSEEQVQRRQQVQSAPSRARATRSSSVLTRHQHRS